MSTQVIFAVKRLWANAAFEFLLTRVFFHVSDKIPSCCERKSANVASKESRGTTMTRGRRKSGRNGRRAAGGWSRWTCMLVLKEIKIYIHWWKIVTLQLWKFRKNRKKWKKCSQTESKSAKIKKNQGNFPGNINPFTFANFFPKSMIDPTNES